MRVVGLIVIFSLFFSGCIFEDPITQEALSKGDPTICYDLNNTEKANDCITKVAGKTEKESICNDYFKNDKTNFEKCIASVAESKVDQTLCDKITSQSVRDNCYSDVHFKTEDSDPGICDKISDKNKKATCYVRTGNVRKDDKYCAMIDETLVSSIDNCYDSVARNGRKIESCSKIDDDEKQTKCLAIVGNNPKDCEKLDNNYEKSTCLESIANMHGNRKACDQLAEGNRQHCISLAAITSNKTENCGELKDELQRNICTKIIAENTMDVIACDNILDEEYRQDCVEDVGRAIKRHRKETGTQTTKEKLEEKVVGWVGDLLKDRM